MQPTTDPFARRVLERIEGEKLSPRPRWEFLFKNYFFWTLGAFAVVLGAFAFSAAFFEVQNAGWAFSTATHGDDLSFFFAAAPFLWLCALAFFIALGYLNIRRTKRGYRYPLALIAVGAVLTSIALGSGLYAAGLGGVFEEALGDHPPFYRPILVAEHGWWLSPQKGLLGGEVVSVASGSASFVLKDFSGQLWTVDSSDLRGPDLIVLAHGGVVRVVGAPSSATSSILHACFVFPWKTFGVPSDGPLAPPVMLVASSAERNGAAMRTEVCKGIRPYNDLRRLEGSE